MFRSASVLLALACVAVPGCASTGVDRASSVAADMRKAANALEKSKTSIDNSLAALGRMDAKGDLKVQYKNYGDELDLLDDRVADLKSMRADLKARESEYVASWQASQATITNPDLKKKSEERKNELVKRFGDLSTKSDAARATYDSMMKELRDAYNYLGHDLNQTGIDAVSGPRKSAEKEGSKLKGQIDEIVKEARKLADDIDVPAPPPPAAAPAKS